MAYFARVRDGVVSAVHRINSTVMTNEDGNESEELGREFLANLYGTKTTEWVMTHYPVGQPTPFPRGKYAGVGDRYDEATDTFISPEPAEPVTE